METGQLQLQLTTYCSTVVKLDVGGFADDVIGRVMVGTNQRHLTDWGMSWLQAYLGGKTVTRHGEELGRTWLGDGTISMEQSLIDGAGNECFEGINHKELQMDYFVCRSVIEYLLNPNLQSPNDCPPIGSGFD
ncbi:MAG: hypothetical protein A2W01_03355 [Candidatus Solincola sediminis]|nr:MAG: hypothetical protein A2W01_03355 [Candidatus Solincola sediminis]